MDLDPSLIKQIEHFTAERDEVLRSLDTKKFHDLWRKYHFAMPPGGKWASPEVPLIMMHKTRLQVASMTETEKEVSRAWLLSRGYSLNI